MSELRIKLAGGKYELVVPDGGGMHALRHGEAWRDLTGDNLIFELAWEITGRATQLARIAEIIEHVDVRCMATDGPVTRTLDEMTQAEISAIYALSVGESEDWRPPEGGR